MDDLAAVRARLERNCRDGWPAPLVDDVLAFLAAYDAQAARLVAVEQALQRYGQHDLSCASRLGYGGVTVSYDAASGRPTPHAMPSGTYSCDCGFDAAAGEGRDG
jgi:hypothetical protein